MARKTKSDPEPELEFGQPRTDHSAGIAKLIGRPSAADPNEGLEYDASGGEVEEGKGVLDSQPATLNA